MKLGFFNDYRPCVVRDDGVVDISSAVSGLQGGSPQVLLENIIVNFRFLRPRLQELEATGRVLPFAEVRLRAPVPRPGKVLCGQGNYMEGVKIEPWRPLKTFFKSPDAVIGPGDTIVLPAYNPVIFNHEAEICAVIGREAKRLQVPEALDYVFGYTTGCDVSARAPAPGEAELPGDGLYGKSFDTFLPLGPWITTADEVPDPNNLEVRYWVNGKLRQAYNTNDMEHPLAYMIATISHVMTLKPGDVIMGGTNHGGLGPLQDGDLGEIEIERLGRMSNYVSDPYKRTWDPDALRTREEMRARREALKGQPNGGT